MWFQIDYIGSSTSFFFLVLTLPFLFYLSTFEKHKHTLRALLMRSRKPMQPLSWFVFAVFIFTLIFFRANACCLICTTSPVQKAECQSIPLPCSIFFFFAFHTVYPQLPVCLFLPYIFIFSHTLDSGWLLRCIANDHSTNVWSESLGAAQTRSGGQKGLFMGMVRERLGCSNLALSLIRVPSWGLVKADMRWNVV